MDDIKWKNTLIILQQKCLQQLWGKADPDASWDEKRELWSIDNRIVKTKSKFKQVL